MKKLQKLNKYQFTKKYTLLFIGSLITGVGISISVTSKMNGDAVVYLWNSLSLKYHISIEEANYLFTIILLLLVLCLNYRKIGIGTILIPFFQNLGIFFTDFLIKNISIGFPSIVTLIIGVIILSIGYGIVTYAQLGLNVYLALALAISEKFDKEYGIIILIMDFISYLFAWIICKKASLGPLIAVFISGPIISISNKILIFLNKEINNEDNISL